MPGQDPAQPRHVPLPVHQEGRLLRPIEVRRLLDAGRTTVHDWTVAGRLQAVRTPGGHRRYPADQPALQAALDAQDHL